MNIFHFCLFNVWWYENLFFIEWIIIWKWILYFFFFVCLNKTLKMHECMRLWGCMDECIDSIRNDFSFLRMHICYLHGSTWIVHETLYENGCMMHETLDENIFWDMYGWMKIYLFYLHKWMYVRMYENQFLIDFFQCCMNGCMTPLLWIKKKKKTICNVYEQWWDLCFLFYFQKSVFFLFRKRKYVIHVRKNV